MSATHLSGPLGLGAALAGDIRGSLFSAAQLQIARRLFTSAEILALDVTPIELVPAPGEGKMLVPVLLIGDFLWNSIAYNNADFAIKLGTIAVTTSFVDLTQTDSSVTILPNGLGFIIDISGEHRSDTENLPLMIVNEGPAAVDGDSTVIVTLLYLIVELGDGNVV